jgi:DNA-binding protein YbaB
MKEAYEHSTATMKQKMEALTAGLSLPGLG